MHKLVASLAIVAAVPLGACYAHVEPEPVAAVQVTSAPVEADLSTYPTTNYEGRPVYYYQSQWYYRDGGRWSHYGTEPGQLQEYRRRGYVQQAPPARRAPPPPRPEREHEHER